MQRLIKPTNNLRERYGRQKKTTYKVVIFELELWKCISHATLVLPSRHFRAGATELYFACLHLRYNVCCDSRAGAAEIHFTEYMCTTKLRFSELELRCVPRLSAKWRFFSYKAAILGAAEAYFARYTCIAVLRFSNWSCGSVLRVLHLWYEVAMLELELQKCILGTMLVLASCVFQAGAAEVCFACYTCTTQFRSLSWSCGSAFRVLRLYCSVAIFELELRTCTSPATLVLQRRAVSSRYMCRCPTIQG